MELRSSRNKICNASPNRINVCFPYSLTNATNITSSTIPIQPDNIIHELQVINVRNRQQVLVQPQESNRLRLYMSSLREPFKLSKRSYHLPDNIPDIPHLRVTITAHIYHGLAPEIGRASCRERVCLAV